MSKNIDAIFCCKPEVFSIGVVRLFKLHCPLHTTLLLKGEKKIRSISHPREEKHGFGNLAPDIEDFNYSNSWPSQTAAQFSDLYYNFSWN